MANIHKLYRVVVEISAPSNSYEDEDLDDVEFDDLREVLDDFVGEWCDENCDHIPVRIMVGEEDVNG